MAAKVPQSRPGRRRLRVAEDGAKRMGKSGRKSSRDDRHGNRARTSERGKGSEKGRAANGEAKGGIMPRKSSFSVDDDSQQFSFSTTTIRRVSVDPDTKQYFVQLSALIGEGGTVTDPEERATLSANALEEASGKELQLACDATCSRVLESLLITSDVKHLLLFLRGSSSSFAAMSVDFAGSHVAEAILQSVMLGLRDGTITGGHYTDVQSALATVCEVMGNAALEVMCSKYGSHVLRTLLGVCSGALPESRQGKPSSVLASRLSVFTKTGGVHPPRKALFPKLVKSLSDAILGQSAESMSRLRSDSAAGPVLQAVLKVLEGDSDALTQAISVLLECNQESDRKEGKVLESASVTDVLESIKDRSSSHLFEVMLHVMPDILFIEMFQRFFRHHLLELSLHESANFVVQALISTARHEGQVNLILDELEGHFTELIKQRRAGVIASLVAACARFHTRQREVCRSIAHAVNLKECAYTGLVNRILHLENLFTGGEDNGSVPKMSVIGSAILQRIFNFSLDCNQQFSTSVITMTDADAVAAVKDVSGCRVVEAFLASSAPAKLKQRCIAKFKGHFAELAMQPVCSFTVEKCYAAADIKLKEAIVSELVPLQGQLSKTKHGPYLLRRCDVAAFAKVPEQWKTRQTAKHGMRAAFAELFTDENKNEQPDSDLQPTAQQVGDDTKQSKEKVDQPPTAGSMLTISDAELALGQTKTGKLKSEKRRKGNVEGRKASLLDPGSVVGEDSVPRELGHNGAGEHGGENPKDGQSSKKKRRKRKSDRSLDMDPVTGKRKKRSQMMFS